jgi:hypothetical protein
MFTKHALKTILGFIFMIGLGLVVLVLMDSYK